MNEEILEHINRRLDEALERGRRIVEDEELAAKVDELRVKTEDLIREHPIASIGVGLAVGFLIGRIFNEND